MNLSNFEKLLVNIPDDKGIHTKSAGAKGDKYVYKYVQYYRNKDGNPRNKAKLSGNLILRQVKCSRTATTSTSTIWIQRSLMFQSGIMDILI